MVSFRMFCCLISKSIFLPHDRLGDVVIEVKLHQC